MKCKRFITCSFMIGISVGITTAYAQTRCLWSANGDHIYNSNTGNVGIGTSNPAFELEVANYNPGDGAESCVTANDAGGAIAAYSSTLPSPFEHFGGRVSLFANLVTAGLDLRADAFNGDIRFYTGGFPATNERMRITASGNLGIGTTDPNALLDVVSTSGAHGIQSTTTGIPVRAIRTAKNGTWPALHAENASSADNATAIRACLTSASPGSGAAAILGQNKGVAMYGYGVHGIHDGYGTGVLGSSVGGPGVSGMSTSGFGVYGESTDSYAGYFDGKLKVTGKAEVGVLQIEGADLAEKFPVSEEIKPGTVVEIDPDNPGELRVARGAYNRRVAGVASGAGDLPAGAILGNLPGSEDASAIALSGRVWVQCDATHHSIQPGDLLTTSDTPGHAMAVTDFDAAQGAILGKAMSRLESKRGLVLVLVTLQ